MAILKNIHLNDRKKQNLINVLTAIVFVLLFLFYTNLRWTSESPAFDKPKRTADTRAYFRISGEAFFSTEFWANARPPMFPLLLKISNTNVVKVTTFQTIFSILSWGILALVMSLFLKGFLRPFSLEHFLQ